MIVLNKKDTIKIVGIIAVISVSFLLCKYCYIYIKTTNLCNEVVQKYSTIIKTDECKKEIFVSLTKLNPLKVKRIEVYKNNFLENIPTSTNNTLLYDKERLIMMLVEEEGKAGTGDCKGIGINLISKERTALKKPCGALAL